MHLNINKQKNKEEIKIINISNYKERKRAKF